MNLTNIKKLLAASYLAGVHDAFEKSKGLDTISLQKNIDDSLEFREFLINELKNNGINNAESILINAKSKGKELFCEKYPDEMKCKTSTPTNKKEEAGILASLSSFFSTKRETPNVNLKNTTKVPNSLPNISKNNTKVNISPTISTNISTIPPPSVATNISTIPPPSVATNISTIQPPSVATNISTIQPPSVATPNASALNPMIQTLGGKRKSK